MAGIRTTVTAGLPDTGWSEHGLMGRAEAIRRYRRYIEHLRSIVSAADGTSDADLSVFRERGGRRLEGVAGDEATS